uniref:C2H2-type domain-containing protein n=1 Tax=Vombatus ursinus TaxID=29139 RepID=A0A4X2JWQ1_VOMUR
MLIPSLPLSPPLSLLSLLHFSVSLPPSCLSPRFRCPECGKGFRRRAHLRQHGVTHSGARPFQCVRCQREFKRLADLARHAQVHAGGPAPHPCPLIAPPPRPTLTQSPTLLPPPG